MIHFTDDDALKDIENENQEQETDSYVGHHEECKGNDLLLNKT